MGNAVYLTADKGTIFEPLRLAIEKGLVTGSVYGNRIVIEVPNIGQVVVELMGMK